MTLQPIIIILAENSKWALNDYLEFANSHASKLGIQANINSTKLVGIPEEKQSIGILEIQESLIFLSKIADDNELKLLIVEPANKLTEEAQNSILKILEEPYESSLILLVVPSLRNLLSTVISRCRVEDLSKESNNFSDNEIVNQIINSNFFERSKIFEKLNTELSRIEIKKILEEVIGKLLVKFTPNPIDMDLLLQLLISIESSINMKLILSNINVKIKKITGN